jgi:hypothetical protein
MTARRALLPVTELVEEPPLPRLMFTAEETAEMFGWFLPDDESGKQRPNKRKVQRAHARGEIRGTLLGGTWYFSTSAINEVLARDDRPEQVAS